MRVLCILLFLFSALLAMPQGSTLDDPRPLVITEAIALPLSLGQVEQAARNAWQYSFGQEPGARLMLDEAGSGRVDGIARFNYRSSSVGSREQTLGVINYKISIQAENGQCRVRISHFSHNGNKSAPGGSVDLGTIYSGPRPAERVAGISAGSAQRLHEDMRTQVSAQMREVLKVFSSRMRQTAEER